MKRFSILTIVVLFTGFLASGNRCMAAGNVRVDLSEEGELTLLGDRESNWLRITAN